MPIRRVGIDESMRESGVEEDALTKAKTVASRKEISLRRAALEVKEFDTKAMAKAYARLSNYPLVEEIDVETTNPEYIRMMPSTIARDNAVLPLHVDEAGQLHVGIADLDAINILDDLRVLYGHPIRPVIVPADVLSEAMQEAYDRAAQSAEAIIEKADQEAEEDGSADDLELDAEIGDDPNQAPIIRFVNAVLSQAIKERSSDIHIEPYERDLVVRYRVDGVLIPEMTPPLKLKNPLVSRLKIMSQLDIAERRLPQD
ncbi:MAG: ATPase, T2SS/T4P/T4SS family, partial [Myxococcota bacterium]